jgi:glycerophosphoryl diester phosphodiesterase
MPIVIAHRGASGYLPEHTLEAKALAHEMGADYLEQDVVASRDDQLIVLHDIHLDRVTDVAERFPGRSRADGRYYARDFLLEELRELRVWERMDAAGEAVYPGRYPVRTGNFRLHTLSEELAFIRELNEKAGRVAGVYPEIKKPAWHRQEGVDMAPLLLGALREHGYEGRAHEVFVQCFDFAEIKRLREELDCPYPLIQLLGDNLWREAATNYDEMRTPEGLARIAGVADGVGPWLQHAYAIEPINGGPVATGLVSEARAQGLSIHPFTFRADDLPPGFTSFDELVRYFIEDLRVDGLFTDFPDRVIAAALPVLNQ